MARPHRSRHLGFLVVVTLLVALAVSAGATLYVWTVVDRCRADDPAGTWTSCMADLAWSRPISYALLTAVTLAAAALVHVLAAHNPAFHPRLRRIARRVFIASTPIWFLVPWSIRLEPVALLGIPAHVASWLLLGAAAVFAQRGKP